MMLSPNFTCKEKLKCFDVCCDERVDVSRISVNKIEV